MWCLKPFIRAGENYVSWQTQERHPQELGVEIHFHLGVYAFWPEEQAVQKLRDILKEMAIEWIRVNQQTFTFDLDRLRTSFDCLASMAWLTGKLTLRPHYQVRAGGGGGGGCGSDVFFEPQIWFSITPDTLKAATSLRSSLDLQHPEEIAQSLRVFREEHPDPLSTCFVMMRMGEGKAHNQIADAIRSTLKHRGIKAVRADDKEYHSELYYNVLTYMHGCGFGVAVFERIEQEEFNPNVSLEVGYMLALGKDVCLLKDRTLRTLHADLIGKLYRPFDPQDITETIAQALPGWLRDKGLGDFAADP